MFFLRTNFGVSRFHDSNSPHSLEVERLEQRELLAGDMVLQWNEVLLNAIRADKTAPPLAARDMAIVQIAVYDAVNAIDGAYKPYAFSGRAPKGASPEAIVAGASYYTLSELFPNQKAVFDAKFTASLATIIDGPAENQGVAFGRAVANHVLALRRHDGAALQMTYTMQYEPGDWQPTPTAFQQTPALPQWPYVKPFAMSRGSQFRPDAPPALNSAAYTAAFDEVKAWGRIDSALRTAEQTAIARFWINGPGTATPPGHWNEVAQVVAQSQANTLGENARMFALLNIALADAAIVSWDAKYEYNLWRPVTAIRAGASDGNLNTEAEGTWMPLIPTPPFPAYTSGHSTFSAAGAAVLANFFGSDDVAFTIQSENPLAADRSFSSFWQAAEESGLSRIYGGIHWNFDNEVGLATGRSLGNYVFANYLQPASTGERRIPAENHRPRSAESSLDLGSRLVGHDFERQPFGRLTAFPEMPARTSVFSISKLSADSEIVSQQPTSRNLAGVPGGLAATSSIRSNSETPVVSRGNRSDVLLTLDWSHYSV